SIQRQDPDQLLPDLWRHSGSELGAAQKRIQVHRAWRQINRMLFARDCEVEVLEDLFVYVLPSPFVAVAYCPHSLQVDDAGEPVLQFRNDLLKRAKDPRSLVQRLTLFL